MEWLDRMNDALGYLEANLAGTADMEHAARLACCSVYHFGRMFSYIAGVPLSEYLRRRRMTLAAFDLQNGGRVLDVALRYGYESPTAFNRAFQSVHGVSPSAAQRDGAPLKAYPRISFKITVKGEAEMDYRIKPSVSWACANRFCRISRIRSVGCRNFGAKRRRPAPYRACAC